MRLSESVRMGAKTFLALAVLVALPVSIWRAIVAIRRIGIERDNRESTSIILARAKVAASLYASAEGVYPGPTLRDFVRRIEEHSELRKDYAAPWFRGLLQGDSWGQPLIFIWRDDGKEFVLRSMGANGKDDGGREDDIEVAGKVDPRLWRLLRERGAWGCSGVGGHSILRARSTVLRDGR